MQGRAGFRISSPTGSGIFGNSRFPRLCMEIPIPKEKVKRLHEGWDLFRFSPTLCLIVSCSQTAAQAPHPSGYLFCLTREYQGKKPHREARTGAAMTKVAGRKSCRGRSQRNNWQRLKSDLPFSPIAPLQV